MARAIITPKVTLALTALLNLLCHIIVGFFLKLLTPYDVEFIIYFLGCVDFLVGSIMYMIVPFILEAPSEEC